MSSTTTTQADPLTPPRLEDLARRTATTLFLPYIINYVATHGPSVEPREVAVIVDRRTGLLTIIDGDLDGSPLSGKEGLMPASNESIHGLPTIEVRDEGFDCAVCLTEFEIGEQAKLMPCKHKYHACCIEKWLRIQGSCPVCRFRMPGEDDETDAVNVDVEAEESAEEEEEEAGEEESAEEEEGEGLLELNRIPTFVFHIYFTGRNRSTRNSGGRSRQANDVPDENETVDYEEEESDADGSSDEEMEVDSGSISPEMDMDVDRNV